jgi:hypothetical protein
MNNGIIILTTIIATSLIAMVSISLSVDARTSNDIHKKCKTNVKRDFIMSYGKSNSNDGCCPSDHIEDYSCTIYLNAYNSQLDTIA